MSARRDLDRSSAKPGASRGAFSDVVRAVCGGYLRLGGWKLQGDWPGLDKAVLLAAPHTSNWDGINMLATAGAYRIKLRWMGKKSLVAGPFGGIVRWLGCVPIDRSAAHDVVAQMKRAFANEDRLVLAIPPEGSRSRVTEWKRGYYHIAHGAGVPIVLAVLDYGARTVTLSGVLETSGDYDADFAWIRAHYEGARAKFPERFAIG
ncbi:MAG: 1-acyl-sn-glycerol-3-phosphate acyltransferase [Hyphomonadaceae bacterium]|nr:1-acyl-sn-glycerol-3-phosphate acyltransferase [Hyphomonadaceae bacterium]